VTAREREREDLLNITTHTIILCLAGQELAGQ
jgi:hypothetical protein